MRRVILVLAALAAASPVAAQFSPEDQKIYDQLSPSLDAMQQSANELYAAQVKIYGRHAVLECRSRMSNYDPRYEWCLEANRGR
jgi:hypothetical protein